MIPLFSGHFLNDLAIDLGLSQKQLTGLMNYWLLENRQDNSGELFALWSSSADNYRVNLFARENHNMVLIIRDPHEDEIEIELQGDESLAVLEAFFETCSLITSINYQTNLQLCLLKIWSKIDPKTKIRETLAA